MRPSVFQEQYHVTFLQSGDGYLCRQRLRAADRQPVPGEPVLRSRLQQRGQFDRLPNEDKNEYVEEGFIYKVMEHATDAEWRLIIALWRFGGLRGSSEPLLLKWKDILWDKNKIVVHAKKTERYAGKKSRTIPLFPELVKPLHEARNAASPDNIYVVTKHAPRYLKGEADRSKLSKIKANLGSVFGKFIRKAGLTPWPKIINNIRASWISDLLDGKYQKSGHPIGIQTIAKWAGNSPKVILRYYGRIRPQVYDQVTQFNEQIKSELSSKDFLVGNIPENRGSNPPPGVVEKAPQYTAARPGKGRNENCGKFEENADKPF